MVRRTKRNNIFGITLLILVLIGISIGANYFIQQSSLGDDEVYVAEFGNIQCVKSDVYIPEKGIDSYADNLAVKDRTLQRDIRYWNCDDQTDQCEFTLRRDRDTSIDISSPVGSWFICDLDGENCNENGNYKTTGQNDIKGIFFVQAGKSFGVAGQNNNQLIVNKKVKPFRLLKDDRGFIDFITTTGCTLPNNFEGDVPSKDVTINNKDYQGSNRCLNLPFGGTCNYFIGSSPLFQDIYEDNGQEVVCQNQKLYGIKEVEFLDGSVKKFQDNLVRTVECCPSEPFCNEDFEREEELPVKECVETIECLQGGNPLPFDSTSYTKFNCINNKCVESDPIQTECTDSAQCVLTKGQNYVCDLNINNYGKCILKSSITEIGFCGDNICNSAIGENTVTCIADCGGTGSGDIGIDEIQECSPTKLGDLTILPDFKGTKNKDISIGTVFGTFKLFEWEEACFGYLQGLVTILAIIGGIILSIVIYSFTKKIINKGIAGLISLLTLFLAYVFILNYFWVGIILTVLISIILYFLDDILLGGNIRRRIRR